MGKKDEGKPRGRMSSYAFFVQTCREEHKKKHPGESVVFAEFTKKCADKWKEMTPKEKRHFEEMAERDKARYDREMANYVPPKGVKSVKRKRTKDPNAPKRALSAFFFYCAEERPKLRASNPGMNVAEVAKELGKRWETLPERARFEEMATKDKERYEKDMAAYRNGTFSGAKKAKPAATSNKAPPKKDDDDDDDEEDDDDDDDDDEGDDD
ncbi:high mobility group-T protein-like [Pomacea canaliculata]|uniref:high mobility group-T protein-like n=1 Tax=Pomacea canaliculata TaxID=400727 RepID=UPI000D73C9D1|nr:high mobility group-T protein-like [Pomacea canaliculata]XP_025086178.1 high mobility group-T protein-like [Pomacea canaliculata]